MSLWGKELRAIQERFASLAWLRTICFLPPAADCKDASAQLVSDHRVFFVFPWKPLPWYIPAHDVSLSQF